MSIAREGTEVFSERTSLGRLRRSPEELISWLFRDQRFPNGVVLLTGTGIVPPADFTLRPEDEVSIEVGAIGVLTQSVVQGRVR